MKTLDTFLLNLMLATSAKRTAYKCRGASNGVFRPPVKCWGCSTVGHLEGFIRRLYPGLTKFSRNLLALNSPMKASPSHHTRQAKHELLTLLRQQGTTISTLKGPYLDISLYVGSGKALRII